MQTLETLRRQINSTESLHSVVHTMKVLSMTSIRQCEAAVESLSDYSRTVRLGLRIALRHRPREGRVLPTTATGRQGAIVFGSAWGMCGRFNENLAQHATERLGEAHRPRTVLVLGEYVGDALEAQGLTPDRQAAGPESVEGITARVQELLITIEQWRLDKQIDRVLLFYNQSTSGAGYDPTTQRLLPLDNEWLAQLEREDWPTRMVPAFRGDYVRLRSAADRRHGVAFLRSGGVTEAEKSRPSRPTRDTSRGWRTLKIFHCWLGHHQAATRPHDRMPFPPRPSSPWFWVLLAS